MAARLALTTRGRGILLAGGALIAAGLGAGSLALLAAGVFALAVVATAVAAATVRRNRIVVEPPVAPLLLRCGEQFAASMTLKGGSGQGPVLVRGLVPSWAEPGHRSGDAVLVDPGRGDRRVAASCLAAHRGVYAWSPVTVALPDPFGISAAVVQCQRPGQSVVAPAVEPLGAARVPAITGGISEFDDATVLSRRLIGESGISPIPRTYRPGDEQRRIHWPATARAGEPMVRAEDSGPTRRAVILLDCRSRGYRSEEGFERAVVAAASICVRLLQIGWTVSLREDSGTCLTPAIWVEGRRGEVDVLRALARVQPDEPGSTIIPPAQDPLDAAYGVCGAADPVSWALPPVTSIVCERPQPGEGGRTLLWDGSRTLASVWTAGTTRLAMR